MKRNTIIVLIVILFILIIAVFFISKNFFNFGAYVGKEQKDICKTDDLKFDYEEECQKYLNENYPNQNCIADIPSKSDSYGLCKPCFISCINKP